MAEEHNWEEANNHTLCANNCGLFGSPTTLNLRSKCYKDHPLKEQQMIAVEKSVSSAQQQPGMPQRAFISACSVVLDFVPGVAAKSKPRNRCSSCNRRVGLTGFTCRCGTTFCGTHRYPEKHGCTFDYKTVGKEEIAKINPVIKAAKLEKI